jgi:hypothetical protein
MNANVFIDVRRSGVLVDHREGHNIWVDVGCTYLSNLVSYTSYDPEVAADDRRIHSMQFGIGSEKQSMPEIADASPLSDSYPVANDPNITDGHSYKRDYIIHPPVTTLERPVRVSGGIAAYPGEEGDLWYFSGSTPPNFVTVGVEAGEATFRSTIDTDAGHIIYSAFTEVPISEVGLFLSGLDENAPYPVDPTYLVAYWSFSSILLVPGMLLDVTWKVGF